MALRRIRIAEAGVRFSLGPVSSEYLSYLILPHMSGGELRGVPASEISAGSKMEYRSPGLEHGALNKIGLPHIHIDGARDEELVFGVVKELEACGNLGKFNQIADSVAGGQRSVLPEVYESHTPAIDGEETLDFFSSNLLKDRADALTAVNGIAAKIQNTPGAIIEVEQTIGRYDARGWDWIKEGEEITPINQAEVDGKLEETWPYEIHHGFNVPKQSVELPINLEQLKNDCESSGIVIGGWFVFDRENEWAYRSNSFSQAVDVKAVVEKEQSALNAILTTYGQEVSVKTFVERVLGIWKSDAH